MNTKLLEKIEKPYLKRTAKFDVGDTISVNTLVREGDKRRAQNFKGIVIAIKGSGIRRTFTIRKISYGVGVEKIFPLFSPNIDKIEVLKKGKVRRAKLYYMRERIGRKAMKIAEGEYKGEEFVGYDEKELEVPVEGEVTEEEIQIEEQEKQLEEIEKVEEVKVEESETDKNNVQGKETQDSK